MIGEITLLQNQDWNCSYCTGHGIDDFNVGQKYDLPTTCVVDEKGNLNEYSGQFKGSNVLKDANDLIIEYLKEIICFYYKKIISIDILMIGEPKNQLFLEQQNNGLHL